MTTSSIRSARGGPFHPARTSTGLNASPPLSASIGKNPVSNSKSPLISLKNRELKSQLLYQLSYAPPRDALYSKARPVCREQRLIISAVLKPGRGSA
jgi:hypothetical protein